MKNTSKATLLMLSLFLLAQLNSCVSNETPRTDLKKIVGQINSMIQVNLSPFPMQHIVVQFCALPTTPELTIAKGNEGPHEDYYLNVYVNKIGQNAMMEMENPVFPVGTVIIKEKIKNIPSLDTINFQREVELYTIMIKRKKGYNPECGDWEFGAISGDFKDAESGKIKKCMECHKKNEPMDFVFRDEYLMK